MKKEIIDRIIELKKPEIVLGDIYCLLDDIVAGKKLPTGDIREIFSLDNTVLNSEFLDRYQFFDNDDFSFLEKYIEENLDHKDRLYVSDLMEFAIDSELKLPYSRCVEFLKDSEDDNLYVQYAAIDYISTNLDFNFVDEIVESLNNIIDSSNETQPAQIRASFLLFRITLKREFLENLIDLVVNHNHRTLLKNILSKDYNRQEYFDYHDFLQKLTCITSE